MPWKECNRMDERLRFVARLPDGEKMAVLCRESGISRKTGYKLYHRYKDYGLRGLEDRARSPYRYPNKLPFRLKQPFSGSSGIIDPVAADTIMDVADGNAYLPPYSAGTQPSPSDPGHSRQADPDRNGDVDQ
jgi:hypothetical protein